MMGAAAGTVAASYPKTLAAATQWNTFNPTVGGRRAYNGSFPQFTDTPGWTWPAGGPLGAPGGYQMQMQMRCDRLEANAGTTHTYELFLGGSYSGVACVDSTAVADTTSAWVNVSNALSGSVTFEDGCNASENCFVGNVYVRYQYVRS